MDPQAQNPSPLTAHCQLHVGQPFTAVCQRCGTYMCSVCSEGGRHMLCAACRERSGLGEFPFRRDAYTLGGLFDFAWKAYKRHWALMVAGVVISTSVAGGVSMIGSVAGLFFADQPMISAIIQIVMFVPQMVVQGVMTLGLMKMSLKVARGETPEIGDVFSQFGRLGSWIVQMLVVGLLFTPLLLPYGVVVYLVAQDFSGLAIGLTAAGISLVALPTMIYVGLGFGFANMELVNLPTVTAVEGLKNSWAIARGKRLEYFLLGLAGGMLYIAGIMACFVGIVFSMGYVSVLMACFYLAVRNGAPNVQS